MKSLVVLLLAGAVLLVSGNFFGWWMVSVPGLEAMPTYEQRKGVREGERKARRKASGMEEPDSESQLNNKDAKRRSEALRTGGGI